MKFFTDYEKIVAQRNSTCALRKKYKESEKQLLKASRSGSDGMLSKAMESHHLYEYALLYQKTPEFKIYKKGVKRR